MKIFFSHLKIRFCKKAEEVIERIFSYELVINYKSLISVNKINYFMSNYFYTLCKIRLNFRNYVNYLKKYYLLVIIHRRN